LSFVVKLLSQNTYNSHIKGPNQAIYVTADFCAMKASHSGSLVPCSYSSPWLRTLENGSKYSRLWIKNGFLATIKLIPNF